MFGLAVIIMITVIIVIVIVIVIFILLNLTLDGTWQGPLACGKEHQGRKIFSAMRMELVKFRQTLIVQLLAI